MQISAALTEGAIATASPVQEAVVPVCGASFSSTGTADVTRALAAGQMRETGSYDLSGAGPRPLATLMRKSPAVVIASTTHAAGAAALYRLFRRRSRLLVWCDNPPPWWQLPRRAVLHLADGVLVGNPPRADLKAVLGAGKTVFVLPGPYDVTAFLEKSATRKGASAHRIVVTDGLEADSGGFHILRSAIRWAEDHPAQLIELCWIGEGDMRGVLAAQPVPGNCRQIFTGSLTREATVRCFAQAGLLIAGRSWQRGPAKSAEFASTLASGMASGLIVLFGRDPRSGANLLCDPAHGIDFDDRHPDGLLEALTTAMAFDAAKLDEMRAAGRLRVLTMDREGFGVRLDQAICSVLRGSAPDEPSVGHFETESVVEAG